MDAPQAHLGLVNTASDLGANSAAASLSSAGRHADYLSHRVGDIPGRAPVQHVAGSSLTADGDQWRRRRSDTRDLGVMHEPLGALVRLPALLHTGVCGGRGLIHNDDGKYSIMASHSVIFYQTAGREEGSRLKEMKVECGRGQTRRREEDGAQMEAEDERSDSTPSQLCLRERWAHLQGASHNNTTFIISHLSWFQSKAADGGL